MLHKFVQVTVAAHTPGVEISQRILLADDHAPTRADIRAAVEGCGRFTICAAAADAAAAVEAAVQERPDACLLDIRMPGNGLSAAWEITARLPATRVVMLTVSHDDADLFAALRAGASGYVLKDGPADRIVDALDAVLQGDVALDRRLIAKVIEEFRDRGPRRRTLLQTAAGAQLTSREWEVLDLLRRHLSTAEIARRLFVSQGTVRTHVAAILHKLRVPDRDGAVALFEAASLDTGR